MTVSVAIARHRGTEPGNKGILRLLFSRWFGWNAPVRGMLLRTMTQFTSPVLHSLLDTDAYKLHMQQAVFHRYGDVHVAAEFRCRGDDLLGIYADAIREQVESMRDLETAG